ncbi:MULTISPECIES: SDR family NAD(P)-dependent oxidoreductase [unclassified Nocardioides]|uniref:SDR family NAD(P)-dependent oxidoreductase n=1 Tax=unclassified Nocardioides TaxID=2615069 RepID=UPI003014B233
MASVLVTGAGRGIGSSITRHLSSRGWEVYATARSTTAVNDAVLASATTARS